MSSHAEQWTSVRVFNSSTSQLNLIRVCNCNPVNPPNVSRKKCTPQAEKWTSVSPWLKATYPTYQQVINVAKGGVWLLTVADNGRH